MDVGDWGGCPRPQHFPTQRRTHGTIIRRAIDDRPLRGIGVDATSPSRRVLMGNSLSLRQLPREGAVYHKTHVVGIFSAVERFYLHALPRRYDQGSLARELDRAAGARLRELPPAAEISPRCAARTVRHPDSLYKFSERAINDRPYNKFGRGTSHVVWLRCGGRQLPQPSAAPSRGSRVLRDSCSREILSATGLFSSRATLTVRLKGSLARELAAVDAVTACSA